MVSIIVPAHLPRPENISFFHDAMASLAAQTVRDFEVVCVINGCCISLEELKKSVNLGLDMRWIEMPGKASGAAARNLGVASANAEIIAQIDADDLYHPRKIEAQTRHFGDSGCDFLGTLWHRIRFDGTLVNPSQEDRNLTPEEVADVIPKRNVMCHGSIMFKKSAFNMLGGYDESNRPRTVWPRYGRLMWEDWDLWIRAVEAGMKVGIMPEKLYYYRLGTSVPV